MEDEAKTDSDLFITSGTEVSLDGLTTEQSVIAHMHLSQFAPTDRPPTEPTDPAKVKDTGSGSHVENGDPSIPPPIGDKVINEVPHQYVKTTKVGLPENESLSGSKLHPKPVLTTLGLLDVLRQHATTTTHIPMANKERLPPSFAHETPKEITHKNGNTQRPIRKGPYFRPPSAISKKYKNIKDLEPFNPACWPRCSNFTQGSTYTNKRGKRKHNNYRQKFYNYKLLYDTLKVGLQ